MESFFILTGISEASWDQFATGRFDWILPINPYAKFYHFRWKRKLEIYETASLFFLI